MNSPIGDKLFDITIITFVCVIATGWVILILTTIIQWLFPSIADSMESIFQRIMKPLSIIQKYSIIVGLGLLALRLVAGWLGWAAPLDLTLSEHDGIR